MSVNYSDKLPTASAIETELTVAVRAGVAREAALVITIREGIAREAALVITMREGIAREAALEAALSMTIREGEVVLANLRDNKEELAAAVQSGARREALLETAVLDLTLSRSFAHLYKRKELTSGYGPSLLGVKSGDSWAVADSLVA